MGQNISAALKISRHLDDLDEHKQSTGLSILNSLKDKEQKWGRFRVAEKQGPGFRDKGQC